MKYLKFGPILTLTEAGLTLAILYLPTLIIKLPNQIFPEIEIPVFASLGVILVILTGSLFVSISLPKKESEVIINNNPDLKKENNK